jgi:steroid 5-alpha reductase family enzyme
MISSPAIQILIALLAASALMTALWFVQRRTRNAGIVDAGWAAAIGLLALFFAITSDGYLPRRMLIAILVAVWASRLSYYILTDRVLGHPEEGRYVALRREWGAAAERRLFFFYQYQALFAVFFAIPALVVAHYSPPRWTGWDLAGFLIWVCGVGNTIASDRQLARFKARQDSRGKTCRAGWWRYSRHPNYFFEWIHWCSYAVLASSTAFWWIAWLVPLLLLYLFFKVTGIPPTEAQALASRGEDYRRYQKTTSVFIPWLPKKENPDEHP